MAGFGSVIRGGGKLKFSVKAAENAWKKAFDQKAIDMAKVNTAAMRDVEKIAKGNARDAVRAGGPNFQRRWPNAVRSTTYPKGKNALGPSALIWIRSDYAGIFEEGGTVSGKPWLWLPLPGLPLTFNKKKIRPGLIRGLISINRPGKPPMLGIRVKATEARLSKAITASLLSRGTYEGRAKKRGQKQKFRVIPLFIGVRTATIRKKWNVRAAVERAGRQINIKILSRLRG